MSKELQDWLRSVPLRMKRDLAKKIKEQADLLAAAMRQKVPVKSGALRDSIAVRRTRDELKLYVTAGGDKTTREIRAGSGVNYDYARGVEFGTTKMPAEPFFYSTARSMEGDFRRALDSTVAETLDK